jgi:tetratricopeptide (TPR) repeat protein
MRGRSTAIAVVILAGLAPAAFSAQEGEDVGSPEVPAYRYEEMRRDVRDLEREDERLREEIAKVNESVAGRIEDVGIAIKSLHIVVIVFSRILTSVVAILGYRQAQSVKDLKKDYEKSEDLIRRIELDARSTVAEMRAFVEKAREDVRRAGEEINKAREIYGKAEELMGWLETQSVQAKEYVKDIESMKQVVHAAADELTAIEVEGKPSPEAIEETLAKYPTLKEYTERLYEAVMREDITDEETLKNLYSGLFFGGEKDKALDITNVLIEANPMEPDYHFFRGRALIGLRRYDEALKAFDKAIELKPDYAKAYNNKGIALKNIRKLDEAIDAYDKATELKPDLVQAYNNKGVALRILGKYDEAIKTYDKAIELRPDDPYAYVSKGAALTSLGKYREAIETYRKAIELKPDFSSAYYNRACAYSLTGRRDEMVADLKRAIELDEEYREGAKTEPGFASYREGARTDADFDAFRDDPDFRRLVYPEEFEGEKKA